MVLGIPKQLTAGDRAVWRDSELSGPDAQGRPIAYSPALHQLRYEIRGAYLGAQLTLNAIADGADWVTTVTSAISANLVAGTYNWAAAICEGTERFTLGSGRIQILPNLATVTAPHDGRSQAQRQLDAVQSAITTLMEGGAVQEYTIEGGGDKRQLSRYSLEELLALESRLKQEVAAEKQAEDIAKGLPGRRPLFVRFGG